MKKLLTLFSALCIAIGAWAESGTTTNGLNWDLTDGVLTISGTGAMGDYTTYGTTRSPWYTNRATITTIIVEEGITILGENAFYGCSACTNVELPSSLTNIQGNVFNNCSTLVSITCKAIVPPIVKLNYSFKATAFNNVPATCNIYVPEASVIAYLAAGGWGKQGDGLTTNTPFAANIQKIATGSPTPDPEPEPEYNLYTCANIAEMFATTAENAQDEFEITNPVLVTYVNGTYAYVEDATGAARINNATSVAVGDKITVKGTLNGKILTLTEEEAVISKNNEIVAATIDAATLNANTDTYRYKYIKVENVTFNNTGTFQSGSYKMTQGTTNIYMQAISPVKGTEIPTKAANVYGFGNGDSFGFFIQVNKIEEIVVLPTEISDEMTIEEWNAIDGKTVDVTINRNFVADTYNTICLPFDIEMSELSSIFGTTEVLALTGSDFANDILTLNFASLTSIKAGRPYLIKPTKAVSTPWQVENVTIATEEKTTTQGLVSFIGVLTPTTIEESESNLFVGAGNTLYYANVTNKMKGMRAYFKLDASVAGAPARIGRIGNAATGLSNNKMAKKAEKCLREGRVIIRIDGQSYNLNGQLIK